MTTVRMMLFFLQMAAFHAAVVKSPDGLRNDPAAENLSERGRSGSTDNNTETASAETSSASVQVYKGPLPKLPGTMDKPWVALHSPVKMYIPIRYTDGSSAESPECIRCPRNWTVLLRPRQRYVVSPVPTLSICPRLAQRPGRVHVAVVSGPRPGQRLSTGRHPVELVLWKADGPVHSCNYTVTVKGRRKREKSCPVLRSIPNGHVICPSRVVGTRCRYECSPGFAMESHLSQKTCRTDLKWQPPALPACKRTSTPPPKTKPLPCEKPDQPPGGILACDPDDDGRRRLPHGGVCQFFCLPHHSIENTTDSSMTSVCQDGQWSPYDKVICVATTCPIPAPPLHGVWDCHSEPGEPTKGHMGGTQCTIRCEEDHVVITSQLREAAILCTPPSWNNSGSTVQCQRAHLPKLLHCRDRHVIIKAGFQVPLTDKLLPRGVDHGGAFLEPACSLRKGLGLTGGEYRNECEVTDLELRTRKNCSYSIRVEESSGPSPHPDDCRNRTRTVDPGGIASLDTVRFRVVVGQPPRTKELIAQCSSEGSMAVGTHLIQCTATDPDTEATDTCSYWLTVKEKSCPVLRPIPNGQVVCPSRSVGARCHYECAPGFTMGAHPSERTCRPDFKWHPDSAPVCEIQSPVLESGCEDLTLTAHAPLNVSVPLPLFLTPLNRTATVACEPDLLTEPGEHRVKCEAGPSGCSFNVTLLLEEETQMPSTDVVNISNEVSSCEILEAPLHGSLDCTTGEEIEECHVTCDPGYDFTGGQPLTVRCENGLWDFQALVIGATLPECLAQLEGTAVEVWMGFEALAPQCDEDLEDEIRAIVEEEALCPSGTRCDASVNCTLDEESDTMLVVVNWTVQADFNWEEDKESGEDIPEAETRLEAALERGRALLASGEIPGLQLFRDSFRRGLITLVCPEGFTSDMMAAKCVECARTGDDPDTRWSKKNREGNPTSPTCILGEQPLKGI